MTNSQSTRTQVFLFLLSLWSLSCWALQQQRSIATFQRRTWRTSRRRVPFQLSSSLEKDSDATNSDETQSQPPVPSSLSISRRMSLRFMAVAPGIVVGGCSNIEGSLAAEMESSSPLASSITGESVYKPAKRPTAYRVDSTTPPTLLPLDAGKESKILADLGRGSGTDKEAIVVDTINLNNMLNKAVYGSINAVKGVIPDGKTKERKGGVGAATFCCLGVPHKTSDEDVDLALSLISSMCKVRSGKKAATGVGLSFVPYSGQAALDSYISSTLSTAEDDLGTALQSTGVDASTIVMYLPLFRFAKSQSLDLIAMSPEMEDLRTARKDGLQNVNPDRRSQYVVDPQGFIGQSQDPRFQLYADRSLLKDYTPLAESSNDSPGNFFAQRILVHEAAATALTRYAMARPESFVAVVAPIADVRYLNGLNGRLPRVSRHFATTTADQDNNRNVSLSQVTDNSVTTILLNPTAAETLSAGRYLRLEIGTGPDTIANQAKVADYLWFSRTPKVNLIPRLMNAT